MQGTLYKKIGENKLALASYKKAYELEPNILYEEVIENLENEIEETLP
jgi:Tfp pilus assembly protein PilF